jgi:hypothetical protein
MEENIKGADGIGALGAQLPGKNLSDFAITNECDLHLLSLAFTIRPRLTKLRRRGLNDK